MASTASNVLQALSFRRTEKPRATSQIQATKPEPTYRRNLSVRGRRQWLFLVATTMTGLKAAELPSRAEDIPLFGLRKKLKKVEEEAEEIVKEGFEAAEKGLEAAEKGIVAAEKGIETAEEEIESAVSFGGLAQAGVVAGAEFIGILVATTVVNGILRPENQKS